MAKLKSKNGSAKKPSHTAVLPLPNNLLNTDKRKKDNTLNVDTLVDGVVYTARNFLTATECQAWIDFVESSQGLDYTSHPASRYIAHRECFRWQRNDWTFAEEIYARMQPILEQLRFGLATEPVACNGNLRLYRYDKGMSFGRHIDESNETERGRTQVTVLIYLSDCQGGGTRFYTSKRQSVCFEPQAGAILWHVHGAQCLEHEACPVEGGIKYILRTDLIYK